MAKSKTEKGYARTARFDSADGSSSVFGVEGRGENPALGILRATAAQSAEMELETLRRKGKLSRETERAARSRAARWLAEQERKLRTLGVPQHLQQLFGATTKREAEKLARNLVLNDEDFSRLVFNAHTQLGYHHRLEVREFRPEHHAAMFQDVVDGLDAVASSGSLPDNPVGISRKTDALFRERKRLTMHMFKRGAKWHVFFFDFNDMADDKFGPHVHYLSHRWAEIAFDEVMEALEHRRQSLPRGVHVRFERRRSDAPGRRLLISATGGVYRTDSGK